MHSITRLSLAEQIAAHLREGIQQGRWSDLLPGVQQLATELGVARHTVRSALQLLENEGVITARGLGRSRSITSAGASGAKKRPLRIAILCHDARLTDCPQTSMILIQIMHALEDAGHVTFFCKKSQIELKHDVARISRQLTTAQADAWIVEAGSSPLLEWCSTQETPCLALYGRSANQPLACVRVNLESAYRAAIQRLLAHGHRRIVLIIREPLRKPTPGILACMLIEELRLQGIQTSSYNLPDWEETAEGFRQLLERLFKTTPPTALIIDETARVFATLAHFARHGIKVPGQVSLVSTDSDATMDWCDPPIARMPWDGMPIAQNVVQWVNALQKGRQTVKIREIQAGFSPGGSIGAAIKP